MENYKLYNGEVTLCFNPGRHTYYVNDQWVPGVTSAVGVIDRGEPIAGLFTRHHQTRRPVRRGCTGAPFPGSKDGPPAQE